MLGRNGNGKCPACKGKKKIRIPPDGRKVKCWYCGGTGKKPGK